VTGAHPPRSVARWLSQADPRPWVLGLVLLSLVPAGGALAQPPTDPSTDPNALINYPFFLDNGLGGFDVSGRSVQAYRFPFFRTLRPVPDHPWGLRLMLPVSFGVHDLKAALDGDQRFRESFRTLTFVPGLELRLPTAGGWFFKPFVEAGVGKELSASGGWVLLYAAGARALRELPRGRHQWSFGAGAKWNGVSGLSDDLSDAWGVVEAGLDFRYPLGASIASRELDSSVYLIARRFFSDLVFNRIGQEPIEIEAQYEIGFTFGTEGPIRLWRFKLPRIGLGYRFGGDLRAYRVNFGFPF